MVRRLDWEGVKEDICELYDEQRKPLSKVRRIMHKKGFNASLRAYRSKVREWGIKRSDVPKSTNAANCSDLSNCDADPVLQTTLTRTNLHTHLEPQDNHTDDTVADLCPKTARGQQAWAEPVIRPPFSEPQHQSLSQAANYAGIVRQIHEAPCSDRQIELLYKDHFNSDGSTFLHHVAALGRIQNVLIEILLYLTTHGYSINKLDQSGSSALHVAICHDRIDNAVALLEYGADPLLPDSSGQLPLHMAIIRGSVPLVEVLHSRAPHAATMPIQTFSDKPGRCALDLIIDRLVNENYMSEKSVCSSVTKRMLLEILKSTSTIESTAYLDEHARANWILLRQVVDATGLPFDHELVRILMQVLGHEENWLPMMMTYI